jgi:hypothetical protein
VLALEIDKSEPPLFLLEFLPLSLIRLTATNELVLQILQLELTGGTDSLAGCPLSQNFDLREDFSFLVFKRSFALVRQACACPTPPHGGILCLAAKHAALTLSKAIETLLPRAKTENRKFSSSRICEG